MRDLRVQGLALLAPCAAQQRDDPALSVAMAELLLELGRNDQALALLSAELVRAPDEKRLLFALAAARERSGDLDGAVGLMQALLRAEPQNAAALNFVGYVWADHGLRLDEARAMLRRAVELEPDDPHILDSLGWCEVRRGDLEAGIRQLERARELAPRDSTVLHHLATAYHRSGRRADAEELWQEALRLLDRDPDPRLRKAIEEAKLPAAASR